MNKCHQTLPRPHSPYSEVLLPRFQLPLPQDPDSSPRHPRSRTYFRNDRWPWPLPCSEIHWCPAVPYLPEGVFPVPYPGNRPTQNFLLRHNRSDHNHNLLHTCPDYPKTSVEDPCGIHCPIQCFCTQAYRLTIPVHWLQILSGNYILPHATVSHNCYCPHPYRIRPVSLARCELPHKHNSHCSLCRYRLLPQPAP